MLLNAEIKDDNYDAMPRQQLQSEYAQPTNTYLVADAATGKNYIDLNAASKSFQGAWIFGTENIQCHQNGLRAEWRQWLPVPAGIADGVLLRGNVIYQNPDGSYRTSNDQYEGTIRTSFGERVFEGETQHTFYGRDLPNGSTQVVARLSIPLTQRLAHNPMFVLPSKQVARYNNNSGERPVVANTYASYQRYDQPAGEQPAPQNVATYGQQQDGGF